MQYFARSTTFCTRFQFLFIFENSRVAKKYFKKNVFAALCGAPVISFKVTDTTLFDKGFENKLRFICLFWEKPAAYGSVSAGREKWPFNVLFFFKSRASL